jgi:hypothetical protein
MIPNELAEQVREEIKGLKEVHDRFAETYKRICVHFGGSDWRRGELETLFHQVRTVIIPIMELEGMNNKAVQSLCSWAERHVLSQ